MEAGPVEILLIRPPAPGHERVHAGSEPEGRRQERGPARRAARLPLPEATQLWVLFKKITSSCPLKSQSPVNTLAASRLAVA